MRGQSRASIVRSRTRRRTGQLGVQGEHMSTAHNKALIRRYYDVLNRKDFPAFDELVAPNVTYNGVAVGREGLRQFSTNLRVAFPDDHITIEEMVAEDDLVATY